MVLKVYWCMAWRCGTQTAQPDTGKPCRGLLREQEQSSAAPCPPWRTLQPPVGWSGQEELWVTHHTPATAISNSSLRVYRSLGSRTNRLRNTFYPWAIRLLNAWPPPNEYVKSSTIFTYFLKKDTLLCLLLLFVFVFLLFALLYFALWVVSTTPNSLYKFALWQ